MTPEVAPLAAPSPPEGRVGASPGAARRRLPVGAEVMPGGGVQFRVWAPARRRVEVVFAAAGAPPPEDAAGGWRLPGQAAVALAPAPREQGPESDERGESEETG